MLRVCGKYEGDALCSALRCRTRFYKLPTWRHEGGRAGIPGAAYKRQLAKSCYRLIA